MKQIASIRAIGLDWELRWNSNVHISDVRTTTSESNVHGVLLPDEMRLIRLGRYVRAASLDEISETS